MTAFMLSISVVTLLSFSLAAQGADIFTYVGTTNQGEPCQISLPKTLKGCTASLQNKEGIAQTLLGSASEVQSQAKSWVATDLMIKQANQNFFSSMDEHSINQVFYIVTMKCELNDNKLPISYTVQSQKVDTTGIGVKVENINCQGLQIQ